MIAEYENCVEYRNEQGQLHREDGPAIVYNDGTKYYYRNGLIHREDGPAIEYKDGTVVYYTNDSLHREDGPAVIFGNGEKEYWLYVGKDSRGFRFHAFYCKSYPDEIKYRVRAACRNFTGNQALVHWKDNPECLELAKKAIAKFDVIKALIDKE
jgi:hypothetical protein